MIEQLPFEITKGEYQGKKFDIKSHTSPYDMQVKINELVDAVNELQISANRMGFDKPKEDKQAQCAEAQKWVGCICRFWYDNSNDTCLDYLDKVQVGKDGLEYRGRETYDWFPYCKPVLPTDKAIYKGGE